MDIESDFDRPPGGDDLDATAVAAKAALGESDWTAAAAGLELVVRGRPVDLDVRYDLSIAYEGLGRLNDAAEILNDSRLAGGGKAKQRLVKLYLKMKDFEAALPLLDELVAAAPDNPKFVQWKSVCEERLSRRVEELADESREFTVNERLQEARELISAHRYEEAEAIYRLVLAEQPSNARANLQLGQLYISLKKWTDAVEPLRAGLALCPGDRKAATQLAQAWIKVDQPADALAVLESHDDDVPDLERLFLAQRCHRKLRDWGAVSETGEKLLSLMEVGDPRRKLISDMRQSALAEIESARIDELTSTGDPRIDTRIQRARELVVDGLLDEAEAMFVQLLADHPDTTAAQIQLGHLLIRQRKWDDAIHFLRAGLAVDPGNRKITTSLALALFKVGMAAEALSLLDPLADRDENAGLLFLMQRCHMRLHNWAEAEKAGARVLEVVADDDPVRKLASDLMQDAAVELEATRIDAIVETGDIEHAISSLRQFAQHYPRSALAWLKLGKSLSLAGHDGEAIAAFREAFNLRPEDMRVREALTRAVVASADEDEILRYVQQAISAGTADFECHRWLAQFHNKSHNWSGVLECARNALELSPNNGSAHLLAARALMRLGRLAEALDELSILLALGPHRIAALQLKADVYIRLARLDDAIELYLEALKKAPDHALIHHRLSYAYLLKGDIAGFHRFHEKRRRVSTFLTNNKEYGFLDWNGEVPIEGKLLVWSETGLGVGQNILHMTFLKSLVSLGFKVVFELEPRLLDLCQRSFPDIEVVATGAELPEGISHHTPIGSLSRWFKPDLASFQSLGPYLLPEVQAVAAHRTRLQSAAGEGQLLVGISWTSNNPFVGDEKSVQLDRLLDSISSPSVTLINLQYGDHSETIALAEAATGKRLMESGVDNSDDLDGLAAVVAALDLVVCIGHTTAHIAGAVGTPNFVLLPAGPFAHWLAQGEQCIWYPASRLFRQAPIDGTWDSVLKRVATAVGEFANRYVSKSWLSSTLLSGLEATPVRAASLSLEDLHNTIESFAAQGAYRSALKLIGRLPSDGLTPEIGKQRGELLGLLGRWNDAREAYLALRSSDGLNVSEIDKEILSLNLVMHDLEAALPLARTLADEDPVYRLTLAIILYRLRQHDDALEELRELSLSTPQIEGLSTLVGTILLEKGDYKRAENYLTVQAAVNRRTDDYTLLGRSLSLQGRSQEALAVFEKGVDLSQKRTDPAANFWRTQERIKMDLVELIPLPPLIGDMPRVIKDDLVLFAVADNNYFWEHGLVLLGSLGRNSPRSKCHIHVINPDEGVAPAIEAIRSRIPDLDLTFTYEQVDLTDCSEAHARTYYASVRFVRLAEIFKRAPATYLCLDVDGVVRGDLARVDAGSTIKDVGVRMRFDERPQMGMVASASILRPTPGASRFIDRVSSLIATTLEAREAVWFLDQVVINHVMREWGANDIAFSQLDMSYLDWFFQDDSLIWTGKGKRKSDDNRYKEDVAKYRYLQEDEVVAGLMPIKTEGDSGSLSAGM